jgi:hypothetical protein
MARRDGWRLTPAARAIFGEWYSINGVPASPEDGAVMAARGLPYGDYRVANDFVLRLRAASARPAFIPVWRERDSRQLC